MRNLQTARRRRRQEAESDSDRSSSFSEGDSDDDSEDNPDIIYGGEEALHDDLDVWNRWSGTASTAFLFTVA